MWYIYKRIVKTVEFSVAVTWFILNESCFKNVSAETIPWRTIPGLCLVLVFGGGRYGRKKTSNWFKTNKDYLSCGMRPIDNDDYKSTI